MTFGEKLKKVMYDLELNQSQVCRLTGKSKGSVSQYLSGKQIPSKSVQSDIAVSLGLAEDYFVDVDKSMLTERGEIPKLSVCDAAKLLHMNHTTVRKGLQQGVFPWGYGIRTSDNRWVYFINAKRFAEIEGIAI